MTAQPDVEVRTLGGADRPTVAPFLRWAGGKRWLTPKILELLRTDSVPVASYWEPFVGGGSVFFALEMFDRAVLSDLNVDLVEVYCEVRDNPDQVATLLESYENTADCYYAARAASLSTPPQRAARFIYLNHTSFNGIFRVNLKGEYNVPFGRRKSANIPDRTWLRAASEKLQGVTIVAGDFERALSEVKEGDFVFIDPPYTVAHNSNGFVKYNQHLFSFEDQRRLAAEIQRISTLGARFVLTNAAHESIDELFSPLGRKMVVHRRNAVGGERAVRGTAEEFVFTNIGVV